MTAGGRGGGEWGEGGGGEREGRITQAPNSQFLRYSILQVKSVNELRFLKESLMGGINS